MPRPRLLTLGSAMSLLLIAATVVLWVRSGRVCDSFHWNTSSRISGLAVYSGRLEFGWWHSAEFDPHLPGHATYPISATDPSWGIRVQHTSWYFMGVRLVRNVLPNVPSLWLVILPLTLVLVVEATPPLLWSLFVIRRRLRIESGTCPTCGYSLTGNTSGVCPECGTPIKQKVEVSA